MPQTLKYIHVLYDTFHIIMTEKSQLLHITENLHCTDQKCEALSKAITVYYTLLTSEVGESLCGDRRNLSFILIWRSTIWRDRLAFQK